MKIFLSRYFNNIDKKGRVSVPASYRAILSDQDSGGVIVYPSIKNRCLEACTAERLMQLCQIIQSLDPYSEERDAFEGIILGGSVQLSFDSEGRVIIPKSLMEYGNLIDQVSFVGKGAVFEIWNPQDLDNHLAKSKLIAQNNRNLLKNI
ncbi:MAG: cell division/cell wall cluster transcriptional repressor MraZ [Pseudomonadota bacterium]